MNADSRAAIEALRGFLEACDELPDQAEALYAESEGRSRVADPRNPSLWLALPFDVLRTVLTVLERERAALPGMGYLAQAYANGWHDALGAYRAPGWAEREAGWREYRKTLEGDAAPAARDEAGAQSAVDERAARAARDEPPPCPDCGHWIGSHYVGDARTGCRVCQCPRSQNELVARDSSGAGNA